jgi:hypothetical protein
MDEQDEKRDVSTFADPLPTSFERGLPYATRAT